MKALVLAAGKSTRIHDVAGGLPKPLIEVNGRPVLAHNLNWLRDEGIEDVWINLHYKGDKIREYVGDGSLFGLNVRYSAEDPIMGTAGAAWKLREEWKETFVLVYGDSLYRFSLGALLNRHKQLNAAATLALFDYDKNLHTGIAGGRVSLGSDGYVRGFIEGSSPDLVQYPFVNAAVYVLEPGVIQQIPPNTFYDFGSELFPKMLENGLSVGGHCIDGYCLGIDTPESFRLANDFAQKGLI